MIPDLSKLLETQLKAPLKSGLIFWTGGFLTWISHTGLKSFYSWYIKLQPIQISLIIFGILVLMAFSAAIVSRLNIPVLRLLEGYGWPTWLKSWWINRQNSWWIDKTKKSFNDLAKKAIQDENSLTDEERLVYAALDRQLIYLPDARMPTRLGNILRAYELRPKGKYGLDTYICFPRLWLLMPKETTEEIFHARNNLDSEVNIWIWSFLFIFLGIITIWAVPVGLLLTLLSYRWMLQAAEIYGELIESAFDIHRILLYKSLRWHLPENPADEHKQGKIITAYLFRGSDTTEPKFTNNINTIEHNKDNE